MPKKEVVKDLDSVRYTLEQRKFILKTYWKTDNVSETQRAFKKHFGIASPHRNSITYLVQKFEKHGTVKDVHKGYCGRPKAATSGENEAKIVELAKDPNVSIREMARMTGISRSSVNRILKTFKISRKPAPTIVPPRKAEKETGSGEKELPEPSTSSTPSVALPSLFMPPVHHHHHPSSSSVSYPYHAYSLHDGSGSGPS